MIYEGSLVSLAVFSVFVAAVLGLSFHLGARARSVKGYYAAHGQIHWFVNGIAFAGDYLSAASFLGICGMISFYGYDGFLYSIGYLAGWIVALFVISEPLKRMGKFTFADALDSQFNSRGIKFAAALSTLVVSLFYLIPQMVGAGVLVKPLLGFPHHVGVLIVGVVVTLIVVTAGMVSTTWVQFIKGSMLVVFCTLLTLLILLRGLRTDPSREGHRYHAFAVLPEVEVASGPGATVLPEEGSWPGKPFVRVREEGTGIVRVWRRDGKDSEGRELLSETQTVTVRGGKKYVNGRAQGSRKGEPDLHSVGHIRRLPGDRSSTGSLGPIEFFNVLQESEIVLWGSEKIIESDGAVTTVYFQKPTPGREVLVPGYSPTFKGLRNEPFTWAKLDFLSLMLALFCGTASLPHILIRYYTVKDQAAVRKSTVVGIASIGFFYILTLYLGLGAMTSGMLDLTDNNMAAPLLARSFGEFLFAVISAIAFTTVLGTVSGLIMAASGAVAHDLMTNLLRIEMSDHEKVRAGKIVALVVGGVAMVLGILFKNLNVSFLVGWAFNVAASANLPALVMLLFWKGTTKQGITAAIVVGMVSSLAWILLSGDTYAKVYGLRAEDALVPFSQPGIVTIPLGFVVLVGVSLLTRRPVTAQRPQG
ncbi:MAG: cation acetate symporter [Planctomycetes bacterium]|nr:cation acetate symporter [Planctomycetota bacterium]